MHFLRCQKKLRACKSRSEASDESEAPFVRVRSSEVIKQINKNKKRLAQGDRCPSASNVNQQPKLVNVLSHPAFGDKCINLFFCFFNYQ